jgi:hypothetical protein
MKMAKDMVRITPEEPRPQRTRWFRVGFVLLAVLLLMCVVPTALLVFLGTQGESLISQSKKIQSPVCGTWTLLRGLGLGGYSSQLAVIESISPTDVWVLGSRQNSVPLRFPWASEPIAYASGTFRPYGAHWDGSSWSLIDLPEVPEQDVSLADIAALSPADVWVVGTSLDKRGNTRQPYVAHWNGRVWAAATVPTVPSFKSADVRLHGIAATASNDVWAVGEYGDGTSQTNPFIVHWNGVQWQVQQPANLNEVKSKVIALYDVTVISSHDAWAVGNYTDSNGDKSVLTARWDGTDWKLKPLPALGSYRTPLSIAAISTENIWAVGSRGAIMHWDGGEWQSIANPYSDNIRVQLRSIKALTKEDIWVVGSYESDEAVALHWDGNKWSDVPTLSTTPGYKLSSVESGSNNEIWAVGVTATTEESDYLTPTFAVVTRFYRTSCDDGMNKSTK